MDNAHNNIIADVARGVSKLALTGKACLAPACLRQAVKASFDAPALGQCVTSVKNLKYNVNNNNLPKPHAMLIIRPDQMQSFTDRIRAQFAAKLTGQLQADYPGRTTAGPSGRPDVLGTGGTGTQPARRQIATG